MKLSELWRLYEADKRIQGFSTRTLKAYALQHKMLMQELGNLRYAYEEMYLTSNPSLKLREPELDKRIPKF